MSNAILNELLDKHAFDGSPLHVDMPAYHVQHVGAYQDGYRDRSRPTE